MGIDISKKKLDIGLRRDGRMIRLAQQPNSAAGIKAVIAQLKEIKPTLVAFEPTGGYERALAQELSNASIRFAMVNARKARDFARSGPYEAKTDKADALMLAHYGETHNPAAYVMQSANQHKLEALRTRRGQVMQDLVAEKNRRELAHAAVQKYLTKSIKSLENQLDSIDAEMLAMVCDDPEWNRKRELLTSIVSIGPVTSLALLAQLPEAGSHGRKRIGRLAGLAPMANDSGDRHAPRHIAGGRTQVRSALYMATMNATVHNPAIKVFYDRLIKAGKLPMVAMTAAMHKLLTVINAILKSGNPWEDRSVKPA